MVKDEIKVVKRVSKHINFYARSWNRQVATRYIFEKDTIILESMLIKHYSDELLKDITVEISNMYGCPVCCRFCSSGAIKPIKELEVEDYIQQVEKCLELEKINPNDYENFYVSFEGIGEPSIVAEKIVFASTRLREKYPHIRFNIASFGFNYNGFDTLIKSNIALRTIQIPFYQFENRKLNEVIDNIPLNYTFEKTLKKAIELNISKDTKRKVKVNYVVLKGINDDDWTVNDFTELVSKYKDSVIVKVSFLNETVLSKMRGFVSPEIERMNYISNHLKENGVESYVFGTDFNCELGCGQVISKYMEEVSEKCN